MGALQAREGKAFGALAGWVGERCYHLAPGSWHRYAGLPLLATVARLVRTYRHAHLTHAGTAAARDG